MKTRIAGAAMMESAMKITISIILVILFVGSSALGKGAAPTTKPKSPPATKPAAPPASKPVVTPPPPPEETPAPPPASKPEEPPPPKPEEPPATKPAEVELSPELQRHVAINDLCKKAMDNIKKDLLEAAQKYPALSDIKDIDPEIGDAVDGQAHTALPIQDYIIWQKAVKIMIPVPGAGGGGSQVQQFVVDPNGIRLEIYILEGDLKIDKTQSIGLGAKLKDDELHLMYVVDENPKNAEMEKAVKEIISRQAGELKKAIGGLGNPTTQQTK